MDKFELTFQSIIELIRSKDLRILMFFSGLLFLNGVLCIVSFLTGITAPYGRYLRSGWGIGINRKVAWFIQELPSFVIPILFLAFDQQAPKYEETPNLIFLVLFVIHYFHRAIIFPLLIKGGKPLPLTIFVLALYICTFNGYLQSAYLLYYADYGPNWATKPHIWLGVVMFLTGLLINVHSDHVLRNLRKPGETGYKIPQGGMFEYVSGANFFGEMLEWTGFAVACWTMPAFAFAFSTCFTIGTRAWQHHQYYLQKFEDYPRNRKAVIPFLL